MKLNIHDILNKILTIIDFQEDKEKYINDFTFICLNQTSLVLLKTLSPENQNKFYADIETKKTFDEITKVLDSYFPREKFNEAYEKQILASLTEYIDAIVPKLNEE